MRKFVAVLSLCCFTLAAGLRAGQATAATDDIDWGVVISSGRPPPPVLQYGPPVYLPQPVWVADYWVWNGGAYVLIPGYWQPAPNNYGYAPPRWVVPRPLPQQYFQYGERRHGHGHGHHPRRW